MVLILTKVIPKITELLFVALVELRISSVDDRELKIFQEIHTLTCEHTSSFVKQDDIKS
jgi:hypothetical protein